MAGDVGHFAEVAEPGISFERRQNYHETMIPNFPAGATIGAIHAACVQMGRFVSVPKSIPVIYGIRTDPTNRFGLLADSFAKNALEGTVTGSELIERHTALPIFASLLTPESRALWKEAQLAGDTNAWMRYFPPNTSGDLFAETPRMCPSCVDEDVARFGVPYWRVGGAQNYIFGVHLGFENVASMTALLAILHAAEDKVDFCARYGIHIEPDDWLATTFHRHPVDNGEVKGSDAMAALQEAEAGAQFGPAYVALNKSPLESNHKVTQVRLDHRTPGSTMGRIRERGEPSRAELARLNFHEYMALLIKDILYHNNEEIIELPTLEMRRAGVEPTRRGVILWMQQNGYVASTPRNLDVLRVRCLPSLRGVIHQDGVHVLDPTTKTRRLIPNLVQAT
jgi:hypothetical protein